MGRDTALHQPASHPCWALEKPSRPDSDAEARESWTQEPPRMAKHRANTPYAAPGRLVRPFLTLQKGRSEPASLSTPPGRGMATQRQFL